LTRPLSFYYKTAMADYSYHQLKHTKVAELRDIASKIDPPIEGYSQLHKDQLVEKICRQLKVDMYAHHEVKGLDKAPVKKQLRELKKSRDEALAARDHKKLKDLRRQIHGLNRAIRRAAV
jgi:hypothetical protein